MQTNGHSRKRWLALLCLAAAAIAKIPLHSSASKVVAESDVTRLDTLIQERSYSELSRQLLSAKLAPMERAYFQAILDDRTNRPEQAAAELEKILPELRKVNVQRATIALQALAYDYFDLGLYGQASDTLSEVLNKFGGELRPAAKQNTTNDRNTFDSLRGATPQSVSGERSFKVPIHRDSINDLEVPVRINGSYQWWIFDTGANITTISLSSAKRLGLVLSKHQTATQSGATGNEVLLSTTLIPELHLGNAVIRNVGVLVLDDKALDIGLNKNGHYQIQGILGFPVLAALGSFTVFGNEMTVSPIAQPSDRSARLFVEELTPLLEAKIDDRELLFQFDTGEANAELSVRYVHLFPQQFAALKKIDAGIAGAGGVRPLSAYSLPQLMLHLGSATATFSNVTAINQERGVYPQDELFGNLGQGLLNQFRSYTIDFSRMQLTLGDHVQ